MKRRFPPLLGSTASFLPCATLLLLGCGPADSVEITDVREVPSSSRPAGRGATHAQRFGGEELTAPDAPETARFGYAVPEGWKDEGPKSMRAVNLSAGEDTQCYVVVLAGDGGGLLPNLNRWRGEMGLDPLDEQGVAALEKVDLLGSSCPLLEISGTYQGMGGGTGPGRTLLGTLTIRPEDSIFVKLVGPAEEAAAHRQSFLDFVRSLEEAR